MAQAKVATVLCIDDQVTGVGIRKLFLETFGYKVLTACSGQEGLDVAAANRVDVVVLDFRMPDMSGEEVARELKTRQPDLPILLLTGYVHELPESVQATVNEVITKGSPPANLLDALKRALGNAREAPKPGSSRGPRIEPSALKGHVSDVRKQVQKVREITGRVQGQGRKSRERD